jgi:hypothetical protein
MDPAEVAKKNKIGGKVDEQKKNDRNGVELEKSGSAVNVEDEEFKRGLAGAVEKDLNYVKKASVHFVSKGRGVTESKKDPVRVKDTSDSMEAGPFLTIGSVGETACLSCVSTMNEPDSHWHACEPFASPMPMDGE